MFFFEKKNHFLLVDKLLFSFCICKKLHQLNFKVVEPLLPDKDCVSATSAVVLQLFLFFVLRFSDLPNLP